MNRRMIALCAVGFVLLVASCGKKEAATALNNNGEKIKPVYPAIKIPEKFLGYWQEYQVEKSILFEVCDPRAVYVEQGGTEFFWLTLSSKRGSVRYKIHRVVEEAESVLFYGTPKGSLAGTDTTLVILEPVNSAAGVLRVREFGRSKDYPNTEGNIYFVGDSEIVSPNPSLEPCDTES